MDSAFFEKEKAVQLRGLILNYNNKYNNKEEKKNWREKLQYKFVI